MESVVKMQANESGDSKRAPWRMLSLSVTACALQSSQAVLLQAVSAHFKAGMYWNLPDS